MRAAETMPVVLLALSGGALATALGFQYLGGLDPCVLCHWQRLPHALVVLLAGAALLAPNRMRFLLLVLCIVAFAAGAAIALFHLGVEQHWWAGTAACEGGLAPVSSAEELRRQLLARAPARCDEVAWAFLGVSMAGWNLALSLAGAALACIGAARWARETGP